MKLHRVTLEVEVPWECESTTVLVLLSGQLNHFGIRNQAQVIKNVVSPNTQLPRLREDPSDL